MGYFPTTIWDEIRCAQEGRRAQLEALLARYRGPILRFLARKGFLAEEAEDLTQEVLLRVSRPEFLERVDPGRGRFRSLLLAVTRHVVSETLRREHAERRGGGAKPAALDAGAEAPSAEDDRAFAQLWVSELVSRALADLEEQAAARGAPFAAAFRMKYLEDLSQEEVAGRLSCTLANAKNHIHQGKLRFKELLLGLVRAYCETPEEFEEELRAFALFWKGKDA